MTKWFDLGMSHPLALGMAHPLADRLETLGSPKVNKFWAKGTTAAFVLGVAALSAPLTIAESHPENTLEDTVVTIVFLVESIALCESVPQSSA